MEVFVEVLVKVLVEDAVEMYLKYSPLLHKVAAMGSISNFSLDILVKFV